jgi:EpsI family protein
MHHRVPASRTLILVGGLVAITLLAYWPSTAALWSFWTSQSFLGGQGPLVAILSLWLLLRSRAALEASPLRASPVGCTALLIACLASVIFWRAAIEELHMLLLPWLMFLAVLAALGAGAARIVAFPLAYLYFAEPTWRILIWPLQHLTLRAAVFLGPLFGMPVVPEGTLLHLPHGVTFDVTPFCSGVNFLVVGLAIAALIGELQRASLRRRAALLGVMLLLMVVSNWVRVLAIMLAGYTSGMRLLVTRGHVLFGWVLFAILMLAFVSLATRRVPLAGRDNAVRARAIGVSHPEWAPGLAAAVAILIAMPALARIAPAMLDPGERRLALQMPPARSGWQGPLASSDPQWKPEFVGDHSEWHVAYRDEAGAVVELVAIGYPTQDQGRELVNEENSLLGSGDLTAGGATSVVRGPRPHFEFVANDATGRRFLVWSVYDIGGRRFVTPLFSQLWYGVHALGRPPYSVQFAYRTVCEPSCDAARERLARFERIVAADITISRQRTTLAAAGGGSA